MALKAKYENLYLETYKLLAKLKFLRNLKILSEILLKNLLKSETEINTFLDGIEAPKLCDTPIELCEKEITEYDLYSAMKSMTNNKSPGSDGLTKEF